MGHFVVSAVKSLVGSDPVIVDTSTCRKCEKFTDRQRDRRTDKAHEHTFEGSKIVFSRLACDSTVCGPRSIWHINWFASTAGECIFIRKAKSLENLRVGTLGTLNWRGAIKLLGMYDRPPPLPFPLPKVSLA